VDEQPVAQFGFEPRGLRWHDAARVGNRDQVRDTDRVHGERHGRPSGGDKVLQFACSPDAPDEIDTLVEAGVAYGQDGLQDPALQNLDVE
jgi:hypothetical protein